MNFCDLFPGLSTSTSHVPDGLITVSTGSSCGAEYGASCGYHWQDCNTDEGAADMAAIAEWYWPPRIKAIEEGGTSGGRVGTHLVFLFA